MTKKQKLTLLTIIWIYEKKINLFAVSFLMLIPSASIKQEITRCLTLN